MKERLLRPTTVTLLVPCACVSRVGGVASGSGRTTLDAHGKASIHLHTLRHAKTSRPALWHWRSSARDAPARPPRTRWDVVVWPVQEPIVEMVLSLSRARLRMTVLGLPACSR